MSANDFMGKSICFDYDGSRLAVGVSTEDIAGFSNSGAVFIYDRNTQTDVWSESSVLYPAVNAGGRQFGCSVDLSPDGTTLAVGAYLADVDQPNSGSAYVFKYSGTAWSEITTLRPSTIIAGQYFGASVSISGDGKKIIIGAYTENNDDGAAYLFEDSAGTGNWIETKKFSLTPGLATKFGTHVSIDSTGTRIAIAATRYNNGSYTISGAAFIYQWDGTTWNETLLVGSDTNSYDYFGNWFTWTEFGNQLVVCAKNKTNTYSNDGKVYFFK